MRLLQYSNTKKVTELTGNVLIKPGVNPLTRS